MNIKKIAAAAAAVTALAAPISPVSAGLTPTAAYAEQNSVRLTVDGEEITPATRGTSEISGEFYGYTVNEFEHNFKLELDGNVGTVRLYPLDKKETTYLCEFSWDQPVSISGQSLILDENGKTAGAYGAGVIPENITGDIIVENRNDILLGTKMGAGKGSFTFYDYDITAPTFDFNLESAATVEFTIKEIGGETANPGGNSKPTEPTVPTEPSEPTKPVDFSDSATNVSVTAKEGVVPEGAKLSVTPGEITDTKSEYDICFKKDGKEVQPNGDVTVKIPLPERMKGKTVYVYRIEADGKYTKLNAAAEGDFVIFNTNHFSRYVLSTEAVKDEVSKNPNTGVSFAFSALALSGAAAIVARRKRK